jgi:hypothetical protein
MWWRYDEDMLPKGKKHNKHLPTPFTNILHLVIACLVFGK